MSMFRCLCLLSLIGLMSFATGCGDEESNSSPNADTMEQADTTAPDASSSSGGGADLVAGECDPGERYCSSDSSFATCGADGSPGEETFCSSIARCEDGGCVLVVEDKGYCDSCVVDAECLNNGVCQSVGGASGCLPTCAGDGDCDSKASCLPLTDGNGSTLGQFCYPRAGNCVDVPLGVVGEDCAQGPDCASGLCFSYTNGSMSCSDFCGSDFGCPQSYTCIPLPDDMNGDGTTDSWTSVCIPIEAGGAPAGTLCDPQASACSGYCLQGVDTAACLDSCGLTDDVCFNACYTTGINSGDFACSSSCETDNDCPGNMVCEELGLFLSETSRANTRMCLLTDEVVCRVTNGGVEVCDGKDNDCSGQIDEGDVCGATTTEVIEIDLGMIGLFGTGQPTQWIEINVPSNALSLTVMVEGLQESLAAVAGAYNPNNQDVTAALGGYAADDTLVFQIPQSPSVALIPGTWSFSLVNWNKAVNGRITAFIKTGPPPINQRLCLNLFFVGTEVNSTTAQSSSVFQGIVDEVRSIYSGANVAIDASCISYYDVNSSSLSYIDSTDGYNSELYQLFATSSSAALDERINIFFVRSIAGSGGFTTLGVAGGIPGPPGVNGTQSSGVAVGLESYGGPGTMAAYADDIASTWAHEMGHYLGLYHTSEQNGASHDPLPDTSECSSSRDSNGDGYVSVEECSGSGADNLMFWSSGGRQSDISSTQGDVMRLNPVTR